ncbi:GFA family protein [Motiliproteus sp. MSK22-1]|uniref:GFA family protein n=1 Tax=Motiliproteus sp. MSK22-1 TaxID=1897630 RepID=UPI000977E28E|nr:GFA family protein [Motiliproteus sp. MSK22-1]OMH38066.1 aldehyde-activating protein [Motiliproteus sp. MSK22-1]
MGNESILGSCLCGEVKYQINGPFSVFQYCHCSRCRKFTGSAHASNIFVPPEQFLWLQGESQVGRFEPADTRHFATAFCQRCGSSLPWMNKSHTLYIVPAGTLDSDPGIRPSQNIFWDSKAAWAIETCDLVKFDQLPGRHQ